MSTRQRLSSLAARPALPPPPPPPPTQGRPYGRLRRRTASDPTFGPTAIRDVAAAPFRTPLALSRQCTGARPTVQERSERRCVISCSLVDAGSDGLAHGEMELVDFVPGVVVVEARRLRQGHDDAGAGLHGAGHGCGGGRRGGGGARREASFLNGARDHRARPAILAPGSPPHTHTPPAQSRSPGGPSFADSFGLSPSRSLDAAASATWAARAVAVPAGTTSAELSAGLALPQGRL